MNIESIYLSLRRLVVNVKTLQGTKGQAYMVLGVTWSLLDKGKITQLGKVLKENFPEEFNEQGDGKFMIGMKHRRAYGGEIIELDDNGQDPLSRNYKEIVEAEAMKKLAKRRKSLGSFQL